MTSLVAVLAAALVVISGASATPILRIDHVTDGDTVVLRNGQRVRLVQIDTPEVYFRRGVLRTGGVGDDEAAPAGWNPSAIAGPATDRFDEYGRLLRYIVRARDGVSGTFVSSRSARRRGGAAASHFYERGEIRRSLELLAKREGADARPVGQGAHALDTTRTTASRRGARSSSRRGHMWRAAS